MEAQLKLAEESMEEKLTNPDEGPINFNTSEARALRAMVKDLLKHLSNAQKVNLAMVEALKREGLQLTHHETGDGIFFDLENAPQPTTETVN